MRQHDMVAYSVHKSIDAYLDLAYASKQPNFNKSAYGHCYGKWTRRHVDWNMIEYCYKQQTE